MKGNKCGVLKRVEEGPSSRVSMIRNECAEAGPRRFLQWL